MNTSPKTLLQVRRLKNRAKEAIGVSEVERLVQRQMHHVVGDYQPATPVRLWIDDFKWMTRYTAPRRGSHQS